jgi:hypothetical protein
MISASIEIVAMPENKRCARLEKRPLTEAALFSGVAS